MRPWFTALAALAMLAPGLPARPQPPTAPPSGAPAAGAAEERAPPPVPLYHVELVIFRAVSALGSPEDWSAESGASVSDTDPGSAAAAEERGVVRPLAPAGFQLDGVAERLRASGRYVPIAHAAWSQAASPWGRPVELPVQSVGIDAPGLTGTVSLQRGEFLHLELSLNYAMADPPPGLGAAPGTVFSLHDMHRVRFNERNYFDHPAFGVIALVTPAEPRLKRAPPP